MLAVGACHRPAGKRMQNPYEKFRNDLLVNLRYVGTLCLNSYPNELLESNSNIPELQKTCRIVFYHLYRGL